MPAPPTGTIVLADYVSNALGRSGGSTPNADDQRINGSSNPSYTALNALGGSNGQGYHKLLGIEVIDLATNPGAQTLQVLADDVAELSATHALHVALGTGDAIVAAGTWGGGLTWGYYSVNGVVYDRLWTGTSTDNSGTANAVSLYVRGGNMDAVSATLTQTATATHTAHQWYTHDTTATSLTGTSGAADTFAWSASATGAASLADAVTDFKLSEGDKLDLRALVAGLNASANVATVLQLSISGNDAVLKVDKGNTGNFADSNAALQTVVLSHAAASGADNLFYGDPIDHDSRTALNTLINDRVLLV